MREPNLHRHNKQPDHEPKMMKTPHPRDLAHQLAHRVEDIGRHKPENQIIHLFDVDQLGFLIRGRGTFVEHADVGVSGGAEHEHEAVDRVVDQLLHHEAVAVQGEWFLLAG